MPSFLRAVLALLRALADLVRPGPPPLDTDRMVDPPDDDRPLHDDDDLDDATEADDLDAGHERTSTGYVRTSGERVVRTSLMLTERQRSALRLRAIERDVSPSEYVVSELGL